MKVEEAAEEANELEEKESKKMEAMVNESKRTIGSGEISRRN